MEFIIHAAILEDLVVHKDFRGQGMGTRLLSEIHAWCAARHLTRIQLLADKDNLSTLGFYSRKGWQTTRLVALRKTAP